MLPLLLAQVNLRYVGEYNNSVCLVSIEKLTTYKE